MRDTLGNITTLAIPNAQSSQATGINSSGEITGFEDDDLGAHGFVQDAQGNVTVFDVPGSQSGPDSQGTIPTAINDNGEVTGSWSDAYNNLHGFTRDALGNFTTFDAPGAGSYEGAYPVSINNSGEVAGWAETSAITVFSFTKSGLSAAIDFQDPASGPSAGQGTFAMKINRNGKIVGSYIDANDNVHGFFRDVLPPTN